MTSVYSVPGVSCGHCVKAITEELNKLGGVSAINVDLEAKRVTVDHDSSVSDAELRAGIEEAGFDIAA